MALIGRRRELAAVAQLLDRAVTGTGGHLVVTGPTGAGRTALVDAAATLARTRGLPVFRVSGTGLDAGLLIWDQLLRDLGAGELPSDARLGDLDRIARAAADGGPRLLLVDNIGRAGTPAVEFLTLLASRLGSGATALLATAEEPLGLTPELRLPGLTEPELADLTDGLPTGPLPDGTLHAVWLASAGRPGAAIRLAGELAGLDITADAVIHLALTTPSRAEFLDLDAGLIRLLEVAAARPLPAPVRARVLTRLARELLGDPSAGARRRELVEEAVALARSTGDPGIVAEVLDGRLHALWDPAAARERLATATEIVEQARRAGDATVERRGLFWRFTAWAELGDLVAAEAALTAYARAADLAGDAEAAVMVLARQAMLATIRGRFEEAVALAGDVAEQGRRAGLVDTDRLVASLYGRLALMRGEAEPQVETLHGLARRLPGHFFEATAARTLAECGRDTEALLELERVLPAVLAGSGPRWVGALADLAIVAARGGEPTSAQALYDALLPYGGRLVVWGGANTITGPVDDYLGRLATRLGRPDQALQHLDSAVELEQRIGALPWLAYTLAARAGALSVRGAEGDRGRAGDDLGRARSLAQRLGMGGLLGTLAPPADEWRLSRDGDGWRLDAGAETVRLRDGRGMGYLRALLAAPGQEIAALDLVAGGAGLRVPEGAPILDDVGRAAYRSRLRALDEQLDVADRAGDVERAAAAQVERTALLAELRRASGLGGRPRAQAGETERARVNATRALWAAVERVESAAPLAGAHLRASLHTGRVLRYQPAPGGPTRWRV
ncbi:ATP-binding protein [Micromonospora sp. NBC_01796]|uniref:ATP-binding protein n=1 Tax=Micromonospora sp. NBC_01796 TaxID=2975987 RepID=UPI002DDB7920|nr:ATP-binding protein [Micromonospora sp. NBC_01796]WSA84787.1 ATP-binding protein [Micromonospora sp. NBC_01796]